MKTNYKAETDAFLLLILYLELETLVWPLRLFCVLTFDKSKQTADQLF